MWRLTLAIALLVLGWSGRAEAARRALVIGENAGLGPDAPLRFAENDASSVAAALEEMGVVSREDVTLLAGVDLGEVRAAVRALSARSSADDEIVFFYSGHGGPDGAHVDGSVWAWREVRADLESVPGRLLVAFFDACFSGELLTAKGLVRDSPLVISWMPLGGRGRYLVTSSGANELSYESSLLQGSPFAGALRSGLHGAADANGDGRVTLPELYDYVYGRTFAATLTAPTGPQHPLQSVRLESAGDVVLVELDRAHAVALRGASGLGRCYVLDGDESRIVGELDQGSERLFLRSAEYVVKCVLPDRVRVARASLGATPLSLDGLQYLSEPPTAQLAKGSARAPESRVSVGLGILSTETSGAVLVRYEGGSPDLLFSAEGGVTWKGTAMLVAGAGLKVPWFGVRGSDLALGLEVGGTLREGPLQLALGGGSFAEVESPRFAGSLRGLGRIDLLATHPTNGGALGATLVGSMGLEIGP
jgi:hypothetical protein